MDMLKTEKFSLDGKKCFDIAVLMFGFAFLLRLVIAVGYINKYDTLWYRAWALELPGGLFNIYSRAEQISLDYPPMYLFLLYITGHIYRLLGNSWHIMTDMLLMKFWPILFDTICGVVLYNIFKKYSYITGFLAAFLWLFNPSTVFNSAFWGQTDGLMCLLLLISFYALEKKKPVLAAVLFAVAGLTKYQCLFFTPVFLIELYLRGGIKNAAKGIVAAGVTVAAVFLPFMIGAENPFLFFDIYLGGSEKYPKCTLNAFNFYGMCNLNWENDSLKVIGGLTVQNISTIITVLLVVLVFVLYRFAKTKCMWTISFLFMNSLFMFMSRMHERYQFVVIIFILFAALKHKQKSLFYSFTLVSFITFINQLVPMFSWNTENTVFTMYYNEILVFMSFVNFAVYLVTGYFCLKFLFSEKKEMTVNEIF